MAINKAITPHAAALDSWGIHNAMPRIISATPLIAFRAFGFGKYGGMIFKYNLGFLKWFIPAIKYIKAIPYKCQGKFIVKVFRTNLEKKAQIKLFRIK